MELHILRVVLTLLLSLLMLVGSSTATLNLSIIYVQEVNAIDINNITATTASLDWDNASPN